MTTEDPQEHKRILNSLKNDGREELWRSTVMDGLIPALEAKFRSNTQAREFLVKTGERTIGEASTDDFWGVGYTLSDDRVFNTMCWGNNHLGKALMEVRRNLTRL